MPDVSELLKKVRQIEIVADKTVNDLFAGQYKSSFRGRGMEFDEVREYMPGDDIRSIDWNVTARTGKPFIKRFVEERELTILFLADVSASGIFGAKQPKIACAVEIIAALMFSALKNNDKVGLVTFADTVKHFYRPRKGKANVLHLLRELLNFSVTPAEGGSSGTDLLSALDYVNRIQKRRAVIFLLSDFFVPDLLPVQKHEKPLTSGFLPESRQDKRFHKELSDKLSGIRQSQNSAVMFRPGGKTKRLAAATPTERSLSICARKHDLIAMPITDTLEQRFPNAGLLTLQDAETGEIIEVDTGSPKVRHWLEEQFQTVQNRLDAVLKRCRCDKIPIVSGGDFVVSLRQFFRKRSSG
ncbi:MAG: DUF58 domain-containing protein [Planctomycetaceae bacterium]|jgi:uncharacterized protein (DUF58 family)|nr:DUF58 domain-containing protein [Planctomycetaceae bacterium]